MVKYLVVWLKRMVTKTQFQPPSNEFLYKMGYRFSRSLLNHDNMLPENYMWRAVIINALEDCMITRSDRKSATLKTVAHNWIVSECNDFDRVCHWAMLDPEDVWVSYKEAVKNKNIRFTTRQILWSKYNTLFKNSLTELDYRKKKIIKKQMKGIRIEVDKIVNDFVSTIFLNVIA